MAGQFRKPGLPALFGPLPLLPPIQVCISIQASIMQVEGMHVRRSDAQKLTGVSPSTLQRWWAQRAELEAAAARLRLKDRLRRWKIFAFVIGRIVCLHRRAAQRVYAPGGNGYVLVAATTLVGR